MANRRIEFTPDMDAELVRMAMAGLGYRPIADRLGVDGAVVVRRRSELGLPAGRIGRPTQKWEG